MNFSNISKKQIVIGAIALTSIVTSSITSAIYYNKGKDLGYKQGVDAGVVQGRVGYVQGYAGGTVAIEGYDGRGWDYNCKTGELFFRVDIDGIKSGVAYSTSEVKKFYGNSAYEIWNIGAESTCRNLGYQP